VIKPQGFVTSIVAAEQHGITNARGLAEGVPLADVLLEFMDEVLEVLRLGGSVNEPASLHEVVVLAEEFAHCGLAYATQRWLDVWKASKFQSPSLIELSASISTKSNVRARLDLCSPPVEHNLPESSQSQNRKGHQPIKTYPTSQRDNGEYYWRCTICGLEW